MGSLPHVLYFIFALSNKRHNMIIQDVPVSGKAMHELKLAAVSNAQNSKSTSGVRFFLVVNCVAAVLGLQTLPWYTRYQTQHLKSQAVGQPGGQHSQHY
jgi:hypothetical protein